MLDHAGVDLQVAALVWHNKHVVGDEVQAVVGGLALRVVEGDHLTHVQVAQVVKADARQHLHAVQWSAGVGGASTGTVPDVAERVLQRAVHKSAGQEA